MSEREVLELTGELPKYIKNLRPLKVEGPSKDFLPLRRDRSEISPVRGFVRIPALHSSPFSSGTYEMSQNYYYNPYYTLRDRYLMGSSAKKHKSRHPSRKLRRQDYDCYPPVTSYPPPSYDMNYSAPREYYPKPEPRSRQSRSRRPSLTELPPELHLSIFDTLDPVSSACLGLSSKTFYPMHHARHPKVSLYATPTSPPPTRERKSRSLPLAFLLRSWVPKDMDLDWEREKLVKRDRRGGRRDEMGWYDGRHYRDGNRSSRAEERKYERRNDRYGEVKQKRLKRRPRLERHDIWLFGKRK